MRLSFRRPPQATYKVRSSVWLKNVSDEHITLHLGSGNLRLDKGRQFRFRADIREQPQVKALLDAGKLAIANA
ncbi:MAG: hypothetical protein GXP38_16290 [Chloroflexi bacterium]|nr:hypothetical protein [Chloroflexota bacterium]